jgi:hypothetical protein
MTFADQVRARTLKCDASGLKSYIDSEILREGWKVEYKACTKNVDFGVREAVCALANTRGGEVFVGVTDAGIVDGSEVTEQKLNEVLRQAKPGLPSADWYQTDLVNAVREVVLVPCPGGTKWAYVLSVSVGGVATFVFDQGSDSWILAVRSGSDTKHLDSYASIAWFRTQRRGDMLRACYKELRQYLSQISLHRQLPVGLPAALPYISSIQKDPQMFKLLEGDDLNFIFGAGVPTGARSSGVTDLYYSVLSCYEGIASRVGPGARYQTLRDLGMGMMGFGNLDGDIQTTLSSFATYIKSAGFKVD